MLKTIHSKIFVNVLFFIVIAIVGTIIILLINKKRTEYSLDVQSKLIEAKYNLNFQNFKSMANEFSLMYQDDKDLIALLFDANDAEGEAVESIKEKMYHLLKPNFTRFHRMGVSEVNFYLKNDTSFLRLDKQNSMKQDSISKQSYSAKSHTKKSLQEGFTCREMVSGLQFSYPLFDDFHNYIARVEITYSAEKIINNIMDAFSYDAHILVPKNSIKDKSEATIHKRYEDSWEIDGYALEISSHKQVRISNLYHTLKSETLKQEIKKNINKNEAFSLAVVKHNVNVVMTYLPLYEMFDSKNNAYFVIYTESNYLSELIRENKYLHFLFYFILLILFVFVSYILKSKEKFEKLALYDNVTKLPNRRLLMIELENHIKNAKRNENKVAVLFMDLDGFKAVNDTYGHDIGDELLLHCANTFASLVRESDTVARIGGDEFMILLGNMQHNQEAVKVASKIIEVISNPINIVGKSIEIGVSIGISIYPEHATEEEPLIKAADEMMYKSKNSGKNRVTLFEKL